MQREDTMTSTTLTVGVRLWEGTRQRHLRFPFFPIALQQVTDKTVHRSIGFLTARARKTPLDPLSKPLVSEE